MSIVIKSIGKTAPEGAKKLYRDALVTEGSLLCLDFSNRGTLENFNVDIGSPVYDLAREAAKLEGVINTVSVIGVEGEGFELTEGKGFTQDTTVSGGNQGIVISGNLLSYLNSEQPNTLLTIWLRVAPGAYSGSQLIRSFAGSNYSYQAVRANLASSGSGTNPIFTYAGANTVGVPSITGSQYGLYQLGLEFTGIGEKLNVFKNGQFIGQSTGNASGFPSVADNIGIGKIENSTKTTAAIYRMLMENLDVSGRSAAEVVQEDYAYVSGIGKYSNIEPRPFFSNY